MINQIAQDVGEKTLLSRTGGAPTLAVGMASILSGMFGGRALMGIWYHFAILFEALFILTTVDAGTRVARFMIQDMIGSVIPSFRHTESWANNVIGSALAVGAWGYFLYQGVIDPMGGINTLWPLFGIANQMLAAIALTACSVVIVKMKRERYLLVTLVPTLWLLICTLTAGAEKVFHPDPAIGFLAHASKFAAALVEGRVLGPAASPAEMSRIVLNDRIDATLCALFMAVVAATAVLGFLAARRAWASPAPTCRESPDGDLGLALLRPEAKHA